MPNLLTLEGVTAGYGAAIVVEDINVALSEGRVLALLGRNGTGKTTLIETIVGLTSLHRGSIRIGGEEVTRISPEHRADWGIGWVPQQRGIFRSLTVEEHLGALARPGPWSAGRVFALFPRLAERRRSFGLTLSGGEQQMLAIGRALVLNPRVILLDEPLEGLAPTVVSEVLAALRRIREETGTAAIIVEQKAALVLGLADDAIILDRGRIVHRGSGAALLADAGLLDAHLGARERAPH